MQELTSALFVLDRHADSLEAVILSFGVGDPDRDHVSEVPDYNPQQRETVDFDDGLLNN